MSTIIIAGGTGLIGSTLAHLLRGKGYEVRILTRRPKADGEFAWDPIIGTIDEKVMEGVDGIVNLAGSGIADERWTKARKKNLIDSRVKSIHTINAAITRTGIRPKVFVSASAVGIYGNSGEDWQTEETPVQPLGERNFMVECCNLWEQAADSIAQQGIRTVKVRIGVVLSNKGGALPKITSPIRFGIGSYFDNGQAWYPWIHIDDVCSIMAWAIENPEMNGTYNAVAPEPVRNYALTRAAAKAMHKWAIMLPVPAFALRAVLGEMAAVVLNSNRVSAQKIQKSGFVFKYPTVVPALADLYP